MKYKLDPELRMISKLKVPKIPPLFPLMNLIVGLSTCRSDRKVTVRRYTTPGYHGAELKTLIIEPAHPADKLPCIVFFHGGGFMLKASYAHYALAKRYAEMLPCKVVLTDYRLAPAFPFPVPAEDCYQTYVWVQANASALHIDPGNILLAGDSAGGNLALAVTLMARDRGLRLPRAQLLIYPVTDRRLTSASTRAYYADAPVWDAELSRIMWHAYLGERSPEKAEYVSPLEADSLASFPPTYIEVAQYDTLRDDGVALYNRLLAEHISCELHEIPGACHGFETALRSELLRSCMARRIAWLRRITCR